MKRLNVAIAAGLLLIPAAFAIAPPADARLSGAAAVTIRTDRIAAFQPGSTRTRFGELEFVGGLVLHPSSSRVSGLSALHLSNGRSRLLAITDDGDWFTATIDRDSEGRLFGLSDARIAPLLDEKGRPLEGKRNSDAESLTIDGNRALVGFERNHRILAYSPAADPLESSATRLPLPMARERLDSNGGIETLATSPKSSPLAGASVAIAETSLDEAGNHLAAIFSGKRNGPFSIRRDDPWDVSDGAFLDDGDLLILERRYSPFRGVGMRIRRIAANDIRPRALVDGPVIVEADMVQEIDNMEGLDVSKGADGRTYLTLVSDDNANFLQRSLLLEFRLVDERPASCSSLECQPRKGSR